MFGEQLPNLTACQLGFQGPVRLPPAVRAEQAGPDLPRQAAEPPGRVTWPPRGRGQSPPRRRGH
jgi:hypothetical protein